MQDAFLVVLSLQFKISSYRTVILESRSISAELPLRVNSRLPFLLSIFAVVSGAAPAISNAQDVAGAPSMPLVTRYQGSRLVAFKTESFASVILPGAYARNGGKWVQSQTVEGKHERFVYLAPKGRTALEVQRNYEATLASAGGVRILTCDAEQPCSNDVAALQSDDTSWLSDGDMRNKAPEAFESINSSGKTYYSLYKITKNSDITWVSVLTVEGSRVGTGTVLEFIQPKPLDGGKVGLANAEAITNALKTEGRMAIYGVNFDTGKAEVRADSNPQLVEMAKVLKTQPALKVLIVGHTDNQGEFASNLMLSQKRADAIVATLSHDYGIPMNRMRAFGDASAAPVMSNATEDGRARNRRVELVAQ